MLERCGGGECKDGVVRVCRGSRAATVAVEGEGGREEIEEDGLSVTLEQELVVGCLLWVFTSSPGQKKK
jgi:hypothetical protein